MLELKKRSYIHTETSGINFAQIIPGPADGAAGCLIGKRDR